jgi:uncharacterized membrane protein YwzB|tara:strand:+ start:77 stop:460 length:384 start_codon:yes stop_codon:yes gene_type:complete
MIKKFSETTELVAPNLKKYQLAGIGFLVLNVLYIVIAWWKMPPVDLAMSKVVYGGFVVFFILVLIFIPLILRGKKLLVQILAFIYGGRIIFSLYFLIGGDAYPAVPYLLPCVVLTFYLLGRAAWGWP